MIYHKLFQKSFYVVFHIALVRCERPYVQAYKGVAAYAFVNGNAFGRCEWTFGRVLVARWAKG